MTRRLRCFAFLLVSTLTAQAQTTFQIEWVKNLRENRVGYIIGESLLVDQQSNVVLTALVDTPNGVNAMTVSFDTSGNENWRSVYSGVVMAHAWRSFVAPNGRIYSAGQNENSSGTNDLHYIEYDRATGDSLAAGVDAAAGG